MCEESYKCVFVCVSRRMKTPYLGSVNWRPNYTQGQILSYPSFPKSRQEHQRVNER